MIGHDVMLEARELNVLFPDRSRKPLVGPAPQRQVLSDVSLHIASGEAVGVVGESGSGKTTLGRTLVRLCPTSGGSIHFRGKDITRLSEDRLRPLRRHMQMIFQDPQSSLNPRHKVSRILMEPLLTFGLASTRRAAREDVHRLLERVGLSADHGDRFPHQLSGGQRQRVGIARAISMKPGFIVADEIVSGLDVSIQAQILDLLLQLQSEMDLACLFISHDLAVVRAVCTRVLVMLDGRIVEEGPCTDVFADPKHGYTQDLLSAIPLPQVEQGWLNQPPGR